MTDQNESLGTIQRENSQYTARLVRVIEHDITTVWQMLVDPAKFVDWLAPGSIELWEGGSAKLDFGESGIIIDSEVTDYQAESLLAYSWSSPGEPNRPLRWSLSETPVGTELALTLICPADEDIARSCAGWEAHLMMMLAALEGVPIKFLFERFQSTREAYNAMF